VAEHDAAAVRRGQHQPPGEPTFEVARDPEPGEDPGERSRLDEDERELERRVPARKVEAGRALDPREPAGERGEEEKREDERRDQQRPVAEEVVQHPPGDALRDRERPHERASLVTSAREASATATAATTAAIANPSASASASHPNTTRLRTPSIRYETGFTVAASRNHVTDIRF